MACLVATALVASCGRLGFDERPVDGDASDSLSLEPATATINTGSKLQLVARGGVAPYRFEVDEGGWIDARSGLFVAPSRVGTSKVRVIDAVSTTATAELTYRGSTIFMVGGAEGASDTNAVRASTDGTTWTTVGALPAARTNGALVVYDDRMLYLGGTLNAVPQPTIFASTDGVTWTAVGNLPAPIVATAVTVHQGALWVVSGYSGVTDYPEVRTSTDGVTWAIAGTFPTPRHEHDVISRDGRLVAIGGHGAGFLTDIVSSTDGVSWTTNPGSLNFATDFPGLVELGTTVVRSCGDACSGVETSSDLVTWTTTPLPDGPREGPNLVVLDDRVWLFGGGNETIRASGDGMTWAAVGVLPTAAVRSSAAVFTPR